MKDLARAKFSEDLNANSLDDIKEWCSRNGVTEPQEYILQDSISKVLLQPIPVEYMIDMSYPINKHINYNNEDGTISMR